jgi:lysosomal Pro-X carboxypeptidase
MIATQDFSTTEVGLPCVEGIKEGLLLLNTSSSDAYDTINKIFMPCQPITSPEQVYQLTSYLSNAFLYMAMTDYPYPSSFLEPMPAFPVNVSCQAFASYDSESTKEAETWSMLKAASDVYFNSSSQITCSNINDTDATGALDGAGWDILACNQLAMPTSMGFDSMFLTEPFNYTAYTEKCQAMYGLTPNYQWALDNFGGFNYVNDFKSYSNIIFSNGDLDPWKAGGVTQWVNIDLP